MGGRKRGPRGRKRYSCVCVLQHADPEVVKQSPKQRSSGHWALGRGREQEVQTYGLETDAVPPGHGLVAFAGCGGKPRR